MPISTDVASSLVAAREAIASAEQFLSPEQPDEVRLYGLEQWVRALAQLDDARAAAMSELGV